MRKTIYRTSTRHNVNNSFGANIDVYGVAGFIEIYTRVNNKFKDTVASVFILYYSTPTIIIYTYVQ